MNTEDRSAPLNVHNVLPAVDHNSAFPPHRLSLLVILAALILVLLGLTNLIELVLENEPLFQEDIEGVSMKASTSLCFILLGLGIWLQLRPSSKSRWLLGCGYCIGYPVLAIAVISLMQYLPIFSAGTQLSSQTTSQLSTVLAPMSYGSSVGFICSAGLLWALPRLSKAWIRVFDSFYLLGLSIVVMALAAYLIDAVDLHKIGFFSTMSLATSLGFFVYFLAIPFLVVQYKDAQSSFLFLVTEKSVGGHLFRALLLPILAVPTLVGWLLGTQVANNNIPLGFALATFITFFSVSTLISLARTARREQKWFDRLAFEQLQRQDLQGKLSALLEVSDDAVFLFSSEGDILLVNAAAENLLGWPQGTLHKHKLEELVPQRFRQRHRQHVQRFAEAQSDSQLNNAPLDMTALRQDGSEVPILITISKRTLGDQLMFCAVVRDATAIKSQIQDFAEQALHDHLTGLDNRLAFDQALSHAHKYENRRRGLLALMTLDIDHFKKFNDQYGHAAGDYVLRHFAQVLRQTLRQDMDRVFRVGGEEFQVLSRVEVVSESVMLAERIRKAVAAQVVYWQNQPLSITCSIGVSVVPEHEDDLDACVTRADRALYEAKAKGRNCVVLNSAEGPKLDQQIS